MVSQGENSPDDNDKNHYYENPRAPCKDSPGNLIPVMLAPLSLQFLSFSFCLGDAFRFLMGGGGRLAWDTLLALWKPVLTLGHSLESARASSAKCSSMSVSGMMELRPMRCQT